MGPVDSLELSVQFPADATRIRCAKCGRAVVAFAELIDDVLRLRVKPPGTRDENHVTLRCASPECGWSVSVTTSRFDRALRAACTGKARDVGWEEAAAL